MVFLELRLDEKLHGKIQSNPYTVDDEQHIRT
jgi:hypothetical protein